MNIKHLVLKKREEYIIQTECSKKILQTYFFFIYFFFMNMKHLLLKKRMQMKCSEKNITDLLLIKWISSILLYMYSLLDENKKERMKIKGIKKRTDNICESLFERRI